MVKEIFTYIIGGEAGHGIKKAGVVAANFFNGLHRSVFQINDYPSLIRGGHNFAVVSSSTKKIYNHYMRADLVVAVDKKSYEIHREHLAEDGIIVYNADEVKDGNGIGISISREAKKYEKSNLIRGVAGIAVLAAVIGVNHDTLKEIVKKEYSKKVEDNLAFATAVFTAVNEKKERQFALEKGDEKQAIFDGNQCIGLGAASAGLDIYFAYPMTPASGLLHFFAAHSDNLKVVAVHPENEIAVANMAVGASFSGAKTMVGTSGGGFCLMQEAFSLAGMCEAPVLFYLGQRPGPSTGVPTYTEQGDLFMALHPGQGEFPRIVASPGSMEEAFYLTAELLDLIWRFQTPGVLLSEKHLAESSMSVSLDVEAVKWAEPVMHKNEEFKRYRDTEDGVSPLLFPPSKELIKWNSYEHDEQGLTTEDAQVITQMHNKRRRKKESLVEYMKKLNTVNKFGSDGPLIVTFGSTTMSVREALTFGDIDARVIQPVYLSPFPTWELDEYQDEKAVVIEQNTTGQLATLLHDKISIEVANSIRKYDGRPFDTIELANQIKEVI